jgi:hypothetical protein
MITAKDKKRLQKQVKAHIKVVFEEQDYLMLANYVIIKRGKNNTGTILKSYPVNEYKGMIVTNFTLIQPGTCLILKNSKETFTLASPVKSFEYLIPKKK